MKQNRIYNYSILQANETWNYYGFIIKLFIEMTMQNLTRANSENNLMLEKWQME